MALDGTIVANKNKLYLFLVARPTTNVGFKAVAMRENVKMKYEDNQ
jgi:hypothetical protein